MSTTNNQQDFYCILSMDGATPEGGGYITAGVLQHLWNDLQLGASCRANQNPSEPEKPIAPIPVSFLNPDTTEGTLTVSPKSFRRKMIFAGTSSGAWSALFLAKHKIQTRRWQGESMHHSFDSGGKPLTHCRRRTPVCQSFWGLWLVKPAFLEMNT